MSDAIKSSPGVFSCSSLSFTGRPRFFFSVSSSESSTDTDFLGRPFFVVSRTNSVSGIEIPKVSATTMAVSFEIFNLPITLMYFTGFLPVGSVQSSPCSMRSEISPRFGLLVEFLSACFWQMVQYVLLVSLVHWLYSPCDFLMALQKPSILLPQNGSSISGFFTFSVFVLDALLVVVLVSTAIESMFRCDTASS